VSKNAFKSQPSGGGSREIDCQERAALERSGRVKEPEEATESILAHAPISFAALAGFVDLTGGSAVGLRHWGSTLGARIGVRHLALDTGLGHWAWTLSFDTELRRWASTLGV
jgi:hypothetical protein